MIKWYTLFFSFYSLVFFGCTQSKGHQRLMQVDHLLELIKAKDTAGVKSFVLINLKHTGISDKSLYFTTKTFSDLIVKYGKPSSKDFKLVEYEKENVKLCEIIVTVGREDNQGILTAIFYRFYQPDKIFDYVIMFHNKDRNLIRAPESTKK
jgi:hypothetical protein